MYSNEFSPFRFALLIRILNLTRDLGLYIKKEKEKKCMDMEMNSFLSVEMNVRDVVLKEFELGFRSKATLLLFVIVIPLLSLDSISIYAWILIISWVQSIRQTFLLFRCKKERRDDVIDGIVCFDFSSESSSRPPFDSLAPLYLWIPLPRVSYESLSPRYLCWTRSRCCHLFLMLKSIDLFVMSSLMKRGMKWDLASRIIEHFSRFMMSPFPFISIRQRDRQHTLSLCHPYGHQKRKASQESNEYTQMQ